jgi:hypothetical protein
MDFRLGPIRRSTRKAKSDPDELRWTLLAALLAIRERESLMCLAERRGHPGQLIETAAAATSSTPTAARIS